MKKFFLSQFRYFILFWKRFLNFSGRSTRIEYWLGTVYYLFSLLIFAAFTNFENDLNVLIFLSYLALGSFGQLSNFIRRLRDVGVRRKRTFILFSILGLFVLFNLIIIFFYLIRPTDYLIKLERNKKKWKVW